MFKVAGKCRFAGDLQADCKAESQAGSGRFRNVATLKITCEMLVPAFSSENPKPEISSQLRPIGLDFRAHGVSIAGDS